MVGAGTPPWLQQWWRGWHGAVPLGRMFMVKVTQKDALMDLDGPPPALASAWLGNTH